MTVKLRSKGWGNSAYWEYREKVTPAQDEASDTGRKYPKEGLIGMLRTANFIQMAMGSN